MPPASRYLQTWPTHEVTTLLPSYSWSGTGSGNGPVLPHGYDDENVLVPQTLTETVPVFLTVTEVQTLTITAQATTTQFVAATTIFTNPPVGTPNSAIQSSINRNSSTNVLSASDSSLPSSSSTAPGPSSTSDKFPPFPSGPVPTSPQQSTPGGKLLSGGIAGIIISCVLFVILVGVCFIRLRSTRRRKKDRAWVTPFVEEKPVVRVSVKQRQDKRMEAFAERWERLRRRNCRLEGQSNTRGAAPEATNAGGGDMNHQPMRPQRNHGHHRARRPPAPSIPPEHGPRRGLSQPPPVYREPSARRPVQDDMLVSSLFPHGAVAKLHFDPIRPDELEVRPGDYLRVIALFDDGWAQCKAVTGRRGMVPTACLRMHDVRRMIR